MPLTIQPSDIQTIDKDTKSITLGKISSSGKETVISPFDIPSDSDWIEFRILKSTSTWPEKTNLVVTLRFSPDGKKWYYNTTGDVGKIGKDENGNDIPFMWGINTIPFKGCQYYVEFDSDGPVELDCKFYFYTNNNINIRNSLVI